MSNEQATARPQAQHARNGNCWLVVRGKKCPVEYCGMENCDVCHDHDEPRGECSECEPCKACERETR